MRLNRRQILDTVLLALLSGGGYLVLQSFSGTPEAQSVNPSAMEPIETPERGRDWQHVVAVVEQLDASAIEQSGNVPPVPSETTPGMVLIDPETGATSINAGEWWEYIERTSSLPASTPSPVSESETVRYVDPNEGYRGLIETLDDLGTAPGTIVVEPGRIDDIYGNVTIPSHTHLRGTSAAKTTLAFADDADPSLAGLLRVEGEDVTISDLELDGNRENVSLGGENLGQEYGVYTSGAESIVVERVYCHDFPGYGFDPHADGDRPSQSIVIRHCVAQYNGFDGFTFAGVENGIAVNNCSIGNDRHGFAATDIEGSDITFLNDIAIANGSTGAVVQNRHDSVDIRACLLAANREDGVRIGNTDAAVEDVQLVNSLIRNNRRYGVNVRSSRDIKIDGCQFETNNRGGTATAEIALTSPSNGATNVRICDNEITASGGTQYGVDERDGTGPTTLSGNDIDGASEAIRMTHPESTRVP